MYYLKNSAKLFGALEHVMENNITVKGEFQLTDALEKMIRDNEKMKSYYIDGWLDCGKPETLLETNRYLLNKSKKVKGRVKYKIKNSAVIEPVFIGDNAVIENSVIGPYATINSGCIVRNSIISDSIIEKSSLIENCILSESIIGEGAAVRKNSLKLNLGNYSEI